MTTQHDVVTEALQHVADGGDHGIDQQVILLARLMGASHREYTGITTQLVEGYQWRIARLEAELTWIRTEVDNLYATGVMPTERTVLRALFHPDYARIEEMAERAIDQQREQQPQ